MRLSTAVACFAASILFVGPLVAWTPKSQVSIAFEAAQLAPRDLRRQLVKHKQQLQAGVLAPFRATDDAVHWWHQDGAGELDHELFRAVQATIDAIESHRPFSEIAYRIGVVSHYLADANNPLAAADDDPTEARYHTDYLRYAESAESRFALVFYAGQPTPDRDRAMRLLVYRSLQRGRELYPLVGAEYRRIGYQSGVGRFDDRSTAFGVAAVAYSHAISDIARVLRYIWSRSGGAVEDGPLWSDDEDRVVLLPRTLVR